jgi:hypothetical protein
VTTYQDEESTYAGYFDLPARFPQALTARHLSSNDFTTTYGEHIIPVTAAKMTVLAILHQLLLTGDEQLFELVGESHAFLVIQNLVVQHQFNN